MRENAGIANLVLQKRPVRGMMILLRVNRLPERRNQ